MIIVKFLYNSAENIDGDFKPTIEEYQAKFEETGCWYDEKNAMDLCEQIAKEGYKIESGAWYQIIPAHQIITVWCIKKQV